MEKKDLLLKDFENMEVQKLAEVKGGGHLKDTNNACTSGDVGCCDYDQEYTDEYKKPVVD